MGSPTVDQMIADVKDGVLVEGQGSFSIDQQRYNGQFGGDAFWEVRNGKRARMVTDFTYNAITTDFWANLDAVGPSNTWEHHGMGGDAKGQPVQSNRPSHGSSPILIRRIMVGAVTRIVRSRPVTRAATLSGLRKSKKLSVTLRVVSVSVCSTACWSSVS